MPYLITGATGFIGAYVLRELLERGEAFVAFDRSPTGALPAVLGRRGREVKVEVGDVTDFGHLARLVREHAVDRIIHLAAELHLAAATNPGRCIQSNVVGTYTVLEAARLLGVRKVVTASSAALFGPPDRHPGGKVANDARQYPQGLYEASKVFGEQMGAHYAETFGVDTAALRIGLVYGYGMLQGIGWHLVNEMIVKPARGGVGRVPYGDAVINWTYAKDAARAFLQASLAPRSRTAAYNVRGDPRTIREGVAIARQLLPDADIQAQPGSAPWAQDFDDSVFQREVGYRCGYTLEAGLADVLAVMREEAA